MPAEISAASQFSGIFFGTLLVPSHFKRCSYSHLVLFSMWHMACTIFSTCSRFPRGGRFHQHRSSTSRRHYGCTPALRDSERLSKLHSEAVLWLLHLIRLEGATLVIPNRIALRAFAA